MKVVGVLALQGAIQEHIEKLKQIEGVEPITVKYQTDIDCIDALIIPGGESTAIGGLMTQFGLVEPLKSRIKAGMPVWGTCAGMIILAKKILNDKSRHLEVMDIEVVRNGYGTQLDSFVTRVKIHNISTNEIPLVFIRAPYVTNVSPQVEVLLRIDEKIVACRQDNMLATSFHPELTEDLSFHKYFTSMMK